MLFATHPAAICPIARREVGTSGHRCPGVRVRHDSLASQKLIQAFKHLCDL